jgi:hypothetical protein
MSLPIDPRVVRDVAALFSHLDPATGDDDVLAAAS